MEEVLFPSEEGVAGVFTTKAEREKFAHDA